MATVCASVAPAQEAIVEQVSPGLAVEEADYLYAGMKLDLGAEQRVVLGYLRSCLRETIVGGMVTIGTELSEINGGTVDRLRVKCTAGALRMRSHEGQQATVMVYRASADPGGRRTRSLQGAQRIEAVLFGTMPVIELPGGGPIAIERLDRPAVPIALVIPRGRTASHARLDLASTPYRLAPGGIYKAVVRGRPTLFGIHDSARSDDVPLLGRLLRLPP